MKIRKKMICAAALSLCLVSATAAPAVWASEDAGTSLTQGYTIGFLTYNPDDGQVMAYKKYLQEYIEGSFDVNFYFSEACNSAEEEAEFVNELHDRGVKGMIGTPQNDSTIDLLNEYGMYYVYGSASVSDEKFNQLKESEYFLGTISSSAEEEENCGKDMATFFAGEDEEQSKHYLILSGGAAENNEMHRLRTIGMLEGLQEAYGLTYSESIEDLALVTETTDVETGSDVQITILPGYPQITPLGDNTEATAEEKESDVIMAVVSADYVIDGIRAAEKTMDKDIKVGSVDCFSDNAYELFNGLANGGDQELDYLVGRYGAGIAPAFVALTNALAGHAEDFRDNGEPFRLNQSFWTASSVDEFNEKYGLSISMFDNTYSADDMLLVLKDFNPDAQFADFKAFAEK